MSTDTPMAGDWWCPSCKEALDGSRVTYDERCDTCGTPVSVAGEGDIARLERENASLREELATRDALYKEQVRRAEQAEARALEYKTEHAALLGTSQWQEVEIADLRDDVKRHMKIASECEERALAAEKDAGRYTDKWTHSCNALCMEIDLWIKNCPHCGKPSVDAAIAGAKHEG